MKVGTSERRRTVGSGSGEAALVAADASVEGSVCGHVVPPAPGSDR